MLTVDAAQAVVLGHARALPPVTLPLAELLGLVLAEEVRADRDMPPFDKAAMDGYAVRVGDLLGGRGTLPVGQEILAGQPAGGPLTPGRAARIMTGAPIPPGAEAVVQVERTTLAGAVVTIDDPAVAPGQHIVRRGLEMRTGDVVLSAGMVLRPQHIGVLATVGRASASVFRRPVVAVVATGDELVEPAEQPAAHQIRNGNGPTLVALANRAGAEVRYLGIARDDAASLRRMIGEGLQADMLLLSGGVSAGKRDLVPEVLQELGVEPHFHKIAMKPGKPLFFGTCGGTLVFGLPGNPVSTFACFELFARPALRIQRGLTSAGTQLSTAPLAADFDYRTDRPTYHPAWLDAGPIGWSVRPVPWGGSPDLRALVACNCFVVFPPGTHQHRAGTRFPVLPLDAPDIA